MKLLFVFLLQCVLSVHVFSFDQIYNISGNVTASQSAEPIPNANVSFLEAASGDTLVATRTDVNGFYSCQITWTQVNQHRSQQIPQQFRLHDVHPNPIAQAGNSVRVTYSLPQAGTTPTIQLFDILGRKVDPSDNLHAGIYFIRLLHDGRYSNAQKINFLAGGRLAFTLLAQDADPSKLSLQKASGDSLQVDCWVTKSQFRPAYYAVTLSNNGAYHFDFEMHQSTGSDLSPEDEQLVINEMFKNVSIGRQDFAQDTQLLLDYLSSRPEIKFVSVSDDGTIFARYQNGHFLTIVTAAPRDTTTLLYSSRSKRLTREQENFLIGGTSRELPAAATANVMNCVGNYFDGSNNTARIQVILAESGYSISPADGSLESLRNIHSGGIFYMRTHGGNAVLEDKSKFFSLWTASERVFIDELYDPLASDMRAGRVGLMVARHSISPDSLAKNATHYAITGKFIDEYISLSNNALVYLTACSAAYSTSITDAFAHTNAAKLLGWTSIVSASAADKTAMFIFDRLLGENQFDAETPPQRPFDIINIMHNDPHLKEKYGHSTVHVGGRTIEALLAIAHLKNGDFELVPSIEYVEVNEPEKKLVLYGEFGNDPGAGSRKVTINGKQAHVESWAPTLVTIADLKEDDYGDVIAYSLDRASNAVPLTLWEGILEYTFKFAYWQVDPDLTESLKAHVRFRSDVHKFREMSGNAPPERYPIDFISISNSFAVWTFSGSQTGDDSCSKLELAGSDTVHWIDPAEQPVLNPTPDWDPQCSADNEWFTYEGKIDPAKMSVTSELAAFFCGTSYITFYDYSNDKCVGPTETDYPFWPDPDILLQPVKFEMDKDYNIKDGKRGVEDLTGTMELEWYDFKTYNAPTDTTQA